MYIEKNIKKRFGQKKFYCVWRWPIEHTKTFFSQMFYYFLSMYMKTLFRINSRFVEQNHIGLDKKGNLIK